MAAVGQEKSHHLRLVLGADHQQAIVVLKPTGEHDGMKSTKRRVANQGWAQRTVTTDDLACESDLLAGSQKRDNCSAKSSIGLAVDARDGC